MLRDDHCLEWSGGVNETTNPDTLSRLVRLGHKSLKVGLLNSQQVRRQEERRREARVIPTKSVKAGIHPSINP
jgi:hypothetical protein